MKAESRNPRDLHVATANDIHCILLLHWPKTSDLKLSSTVMPRAIGPFGVVDARIYFRPREFLAKSL